MERPPEPPRLPENALHVVGAAILDGDRCLVVQRSAAMTTPLKWEFPGGKVEADETPEAALQREIGEELGLLIQVGRWLARGIQPIAQGPLVLDIYLARAVAGTLELREHGRALWLAAVALQDLDWATPDLPAVAALRDILPPRNATGHPVPPPR